MTPDELTLVTIPVRGQESVQLRVLPPRASRRDIESVVPVARGMVVVLRGRHYPEPIEQGFADDVLSVQPTADVQATVIKSVREVTTRYLDHGYEPDVAFQVTSSLATVSGLMRAVHEVRSE